MSQCVGAGGSGTKEFASNSIPDSLSPTHRPSYAHALYVSVAKLPKMSSACSFDETQRPKGAVLFTGPDGVGNLRVRVEQNGYVGHGTSSPEASGDTQYIMRGAATNPHPLPKHSKVGEIGWGVPRLIDYSLLKSGNQMTLSTFRQQAEDRHTHLYQEPYYPAPDSGKRGENTEVGRNQSGSTSTVEESEHKPHSVT